VQVLKARKQLQARNGGGEAAVASSGHLEQPGGTTKQEETRSVANSGQETDNTHATDAAAAAAGSNDGPSSAAVCGARACGNMDLGDGVRVTATGPKNRDKPQVVNVLWVLSHDALLEGQPVSKSRYVFLLCDDERFQPCQPRQEVGVNQLCRLVGYLGGYSIASADLRLAQTWQSAPGGPVHAQGTRLHKVGECAHLGLWNPPGD
jgi:hypothetical protein